MISTLVEVVFHTTAPVEFNGTYRSDGDKEMIYWIRWRKYLLGM